MISLNKQCISELINISGPFLMIDFADEIQPGESSKAIMVLHPDSWFFNCHLKDQNVVPGVLLTEAMLQTLILAIYTMPDNNNLIPFVVNTNCKFMNKVSANDQINFMSKINYKKRGFFKGSVSGFVSKKLVCIGEFSLVIPELTPKIISVN